MLRKYKYYTALFASALLGLMACGDDDGIGAFLDVAPSIAVVDPGSIKLGSTDAVLMGAASDGVSTPLASGTLRLLDENDVVLAELTQSLSGTVDTIRMDNSVSNLSARPVGTYRLIATATDEGGLSTIATDTVNFEIFESEFNANYSGIWVLGSFNSWGANTPDYGMTLIADNTWEVKNVPIGPGDQFKFANTPDFSGIDFSSTECDNKVEEGVGDNINCQFNGVFTIVFNDETLVYSLLNTSPPVKNFPELYILGSFNNFEGGDARMFIVEDNIWEITGLMLSSGDKIKFSTTPNFSGDSYGDDEPDGTADRFGSNIMIMADGPYTVRFNDATLEYTLEVDCSPSQQERMWVLGQMNSWGANTPDLEMTMVDDDNWTINGVSATSGDAFKFVNSSDFSNSGGDWGDDNCDGVAVRGIGDNINCITEDGLYSMTFNTCSAAYTITKE